MTKKTSIVLLCLITVITLFFGIFAFILDGQPVGINDYHSAYGLIQKSGMFGDTLAASYQIKLDEEAKAEDVVKTLKTRLQNSFAYYSVDVALSENDSVVTINLPKATYAKANENESANDVDNRVLTSITRTGKVEVLSATVSGSLPTYSKDSVVLTNEHFRGVSTRNYVNGDQTFYICQARLTKEGEELVKKAKLTDGTTYSYAIDGTMAYIAVYTNGQFQLYSTSADNSKSLASYLNNGALGATLTSIERPEVENKTGWIFAVVMGVIVLATFVFMAIRYKTLGIAGILSQLIVSVAFVYALAYIYMSMFNLFAAIALVLSYAFMTFFTIFTFERIIAINKEKTFATSAYQGFRSVNIISLIAHGALLVLGIIFWVIPTAVTAPMGTIFVYSALLSFAATFGLNRLFVKFVEPFYETSGRTIAKK